MSDDSLSVDGDVEEGFDIMLTVCRIYNGRDTFIIFFMIYICCSLLWMGTNIMYEPCK